MSITPKDQSQISENVTALYLRLHGYFTSPLILHSRIKGEMKTDIDCLAIRFPHHTETARGDKIDPSLAPSQTAIELAVCEVKGSYVSFNASIMKDVNLVRYILSWAGIFAADKVDSLGAELHEAIASHSVTSDSFPEIITSEPSARLRGLLFAPGRLSAERRDGENRFIGGDTMFKFIADCIAPEEAPPTCTTVYDTTNWGHLQGIVDYFKGLTKEKTATFHELVVHLAEKSCEG